MMHSNCIAAFRAPTGRRFSPARRRAAPRLTALADGHIHQCVQRQASPSAIPAFYTLCGSLVPAGNVACTDTRVTCPECRRRAV